MKFYLAVLEKNGPFYEGRVVKKSSIRNFCSTAHTMYLIGFLQFLKTNAKIPEFFASWNFLMFYSNKRLKPTTACVILRRKKTHMEPV